jgi:hypothetical protein
MRGGRNVKRSLLLLGAALSIPLILAGPVPAQQAASNQACPTSFVGNPGLQQLIDQAISTEGARREIVNATVDDPPRAATAGKRIAAPSGAAGSGQIADGASITELFSLAQNDLIDIGDSSVTLSLNLFGFVSAFNPDVIDYQSEYERYTFLRRFGGSLTFGGKGEKFDRDGDGEADEALQADNFGDIVTWEVQYRFFGSRDRRDRRNYERYFEAIGPTFFDSTTDTGWVAERVGFINRHTTDFSNMRRDADGDLCKADVDSFLNDPGIQAELQEIGATLDSLKKEIKEAGEANDKSMVWTAVIGGTDRGEEFGPDTRMAAIRGNWRSMTLNLEWSETEGLMAAADPVTWKLAVEQNWSWLKDSKLFGKNGADVALSGSYEVFDDVPSAAHSTNAKLNAKLELPIARLEGLKIPISVTWSNHKDLITDEDEVVGHIGFTIDTKGLLKIGKKGD